MAVDSRVSSKTYKTNVDELEPNDQNIKSELYEVSIFNHIVKIAPGLVIQEDNLSYCYVYAIKNNKVVKKLGVYEKIDDSSDLFDLSTFSEGSLCLFDVYEKNPSLILELEESEVVSKESVFDYLLTKINDEDIVKKTALTKNSYKGIFLLLTQKKKEGKEDENSKIITNLLNLIKKSIETKKYYNETTQEKIKKYAVDFNKKMLSLIVSEPFLKVRFIFTEDDNAFDDSKFRDWSIKTDITEYVIVSAATFEVIETYPADSLNDKYMDMIVETKPQGTSLNQVEVEPEPSFKPQLEPVEEEPKTKTKPKSRSLKPLKETEPKTYDINMNAIEPETKEVDLNEPETKNVDLNEPEAKEVDLNEPEPVSKPSKRRTKTEVKPESDTETKPKSKSKSKNPDSESKTKIKGPSQRIKLNSKAD